MTKHARILRQLRTALMTAGCLGIFVDMMPLDGLRPKEVLRKNPNLSPFLRIDVLRVQYFSHRVGLERFIVYRMLLSNAALSFL